MQSTQVQMAKAELVGVHATWQNSAVGSCGYPGQHSLTCRHSTSRQHCQDVAKTAFKLAMGIAPWMQIANQYHPLVTQHACMMGYLLT